MKSERQKQNLEKVRLIKINEKKAQELEILAEDETMEDIKDRLLKKADELRDE